MVAKLNVFGIKLKTVGNDQSPPFLDLFIIARKMHSPTLLQCLQGNNGATIQINLRRKNDGSLLCKMQGKKRNERPQGNNDEKRPSGHPGCLPDMRHQDVQDRQEQITAEQNAH
jgi:hypothetical protein